MKYFNRNIYIEVVKPYIGKDLIKVFTGQRRVGKSYFCYQLIDLIKKGNSNSNIIYINKELYEFDHIRNYNDLHKFFNENYDIGKDNYLFIDEIQEIDQFEKCLRSILAKKQADIYITGSNAELMSGELATFLSGRYIEIKIYSLSYAEFLLFHKLKNTNDSFLKYLRFGGLPGIINLPMEERIIYDYLKNVCATILFKDVVKRYNIRNVSFLENLVKYLADNTGSIVSSKKISDFLKSQNIKISPNSVMDYLSYIEKSFFAFKVQRANISGKKIFEIGEKYYFEDLGLRHSIIGFRQKDINKILENIVFIHLLIAGYDIKIGWEDGKEIDFICTKNNKKIYVQVAYLIPDEKVHEREFGNLLKIKDHYPKYVVTMDELPVSEYKGIMHKNIRTFILNI